MSSPETYIAEHPQGERILAAVARWRRNGADDFDAAEALYWACSDYYNGQGCPLYAALCASAYRPGAASNGPEPDSVADYLYRDLAEILG